MRWAAALALLGVVTRAGAGEIGHYNPAVVSIRDYVMPEPGVYAALYDLWYDTDRLNDADGDAQTSIVLRGPRGRTTRVGLDVQVNLYALAPTLMWASPWTLLGARYAAYVVPTFANTSLGAALSLETGRGINPSTSTMAVGDLYVQPVWLDWSGAHFDAAFGMGFYAPTGRYDVQTFRVPGLGPVRAESAKNVGFGFWTQQTQVSGAWYPWVHKATAVVLALTHEVNSKKQDFDVTPGQNLTLNWGVSQYVPLNGAQSLLLEAGPAGYDTWQVTHDTGSDVSVPNVRDQVHAAGGQLGLTYVPWGVVMNFHAFQEFASVDRFQGRAFGLNLAKKF